MYLSQDERNDLLMIKHMIRHVKCYMKNGRRVNTDAH